MSNSSTKASNLFSPPIGIDRAQPEDDLQQRQHQQHQHQHQRPFSNGLGGSRSGGMNIGIGNLRVGGGGGRLTPTSATRSGIGSVAGGRSSGLNFNFNSLRSSSMQSQQLNQNQGQSPASASTTNSNSNQYVGSSGARLLNAHGINTSSLFQKAKTLESRIHHQQHQQQTNNSNLPQSNENNTNPSSATSSNQMKITVPRHLNINQTLESIRLQTIQNILHKQKLNMKQNIQEKIEHRMNKDWKETKERLMNDTVILDDTGRRIWITSDGGDDDGDDDCYDDGYADKKRTGSKGSGGLDGGGGAIATRAKAARTAAFAISNDPNDVQQFYQFANYHHTNIFNNNEYKSTLSQPQQQHQQQPPNDDKKLIMKYLLDACQDLSISNGMYTSYLNGCKLISTLSTTAIKDGNGGGGVLLSTHPSLATVKERTLSSLLFLSNQFREYIITKVKNSTSTTSTLSSPSPSLPPPGEGFTTYITKFVELEMGKNPNLTMQSRDSLFKCMYYCLRCGDVHSALEFYANSRVASGGNVNYGNVNSMKNVLEFLIRFVDKKTNNATGGSSSTRSTMISTKEERSIGLFQGLNSLPTNYIAEMKDLYQHVLLNVQSNQNHILGATSNNNDVGEYEIAVIGMLAFCCGDDNDSNGNHGSVATSTIEDYIYIQLWNAMAQECNIVDALVSLGENIKSCGYEYFEGRNNDPVRAAKSFGWSYAMPLLLAQCYKSAIVHLAQSGSGFGLCMAVHLCIALNKYDRIALVDYNDETKMTKESLIRDEHNMVLSTLLISYAKALQLHSPPMALEYIVQIPDGKSSRVTMKNGSKLSLLAEKEIVNVLLETKAFDMLAGQISDDGSRLATGALDLYFTPSGISDLLASAANICMTEGKTAMTVELLSLAGHHSTVLSILNRQLASLVVVSGGQDEMISNTSHVEKQQQRIMWRDAALKFHSLYLSQGHSLVIQKLEAEGQLSLGMDFQMLLNLMVFFDRYNEQNWKAAWELIQDLDLLPTSEDSINAAIESFHKLSDDIKQIFHHIILKSMECLTNLHAMYKSSLSGGSSTNIQIASDPLLVQLKKSAKSLMAFAGFVRLNHADEVRAQIGKMEAFMI